MKRKCGVLLPISSLPSKYGIGCFSAEAREFVDFLKAAGQTYWQILPLGQTGYGDSPYQSFSTYAGNPYFIDPDELVREGWLAAEELSACDWGSDPGYVDYDAVYRSRFRMLKKAYQNSPFALHVKKRWAGAEYDAARASFRSFAERESAWLPDYALFSAVKEANQGRCFIEWDEGIRLRRQAAVERCRRELADAIRFYEFQQFLFDREWRELKEYAGRNGISIIGDIPIYVAFDSADTWSHPELFKLDEKGYPTVVAGCPPDGFSATGQLWGNPIYRWDYHRQTGYAWWIERIRHCFALYDVVRIDHFRGFDEYYEIPYGDSTAENGQWAAGPGYELFAALRSALGNRPIIAEDLGYMTPSVRRLVRKTGYPGMKVLQFAFDSREESDYLPHNYRHNCVVYTGTHDNETMRGWYVGVNRHDRMFAKRYVGIRSEKSAAWDCIRCAFMSVADTAIIPMQDYLNLGNEARINHPSTLGGQNWRWRLTAGAATDDLAKRMRALAAAYGRI
ncbi:4-alpha-glucanotransferase [Lachnoclostridium sp. Marseille-P6806]|uniref:4-alpha-glucanotransferase n=1 Tax=Lachnoclostridium sp. Marseille-P6806 TaxID=2364793 RepID=UPI001031E296|nr:4-alpha-glucanotransferase [Lachnoclostridium sp. Marseille-P6806]